MNIFGAIKIYQPKQWEVTETREFSKEEISQVESAYVRESDYGMSVCFLMKSGGKSFIPVSNTSSPVVGQKVDLTTAKLLKLSREGDEDIYRVQI